MYLVFTLAFIQGGVEMTGILNQSIINLIEEFLIIILFFSVIVSGRRSHYNYIVTFIFIFTLYSIFSGVLTGVNTLLIIQFLKVYLIPILFLFYILYASFDERDFELLIEFLIKMFIIQVFSVIPKHLILGQQEPVIGTMSILGGSLTAGFVMIYYSFALILFLDQRIRLRVFIFHITLAIYFGIIGEKRALIFFIPILTVFGLYFYQKHLPTGKRLISFQSYFISTIMGVIGFYLFVVMIPSLNPERQIGGTFDIEYVSEFILDYQQIEGQVNSNEQMSRLGALMYLPTLISTRGIQQTLTGIGAGTFEQNSLINTGGTKMSMEDNVFHRFGIGYGARTGFFWLFLQIGLIGVLLHSSILFYLQFQLLRVIKLSPQSEHRHLLFAAFLSLTFVMIDYFFYSKVLVTNNAVTLSLMALIAISLRRHTTLDPLNSDKSKVKI